MQKWRTPIDQKKYNICGVIFNNSPELKNIYNWEYKGS